MRLLKPLASNRTFAFRLGSAIGYNRALMDVIVRKEPEKKWYYSTEADFIPCLLEPRFIPYKVEPYKTPDGITMYEKQWLAGFTQEPVKVDFSFGTFYLIVSPSGAGKTFFLKGLVGELMKNGYMAICVSDIKDEFYACKYPVQTKYLPHMPYWRNPSPLPIFPMMPYYAVKHVRKEDPDFEPKEDIKIFQLSLQDIIVEDLYVALGLEHNEPKAQMLNHAWVIGDKFPKTMQEYIQRIADLSMEEFYEKLGVKVTNDKLLNVAIQTQKSLMGSLNDLWRRGFIGEEYKTPDFISLLKDGKFVDICLHDTRLDLWHSSYIYVILRKIYANKGENKRLGKTSRLAIIAPDIGTLLLSHKDTEVRNFVEKDIIAKGRAKWIYTIGDTQLLSQMPEKSWNQVQRWFFFGSRITGGDLEKIARRNLKPTGDIIGLINEHRTQMEKQPLRAVMVWEIEKKGGKLGFVPPPSSAHELTEEEEERIKEWELQKKLGTI